MLPQEGAEARLGEPGLRRMAGRRARQPRRLHAKGVARPIHRGEYLVGNYLGTLLTLFVVPCLYVSLHALLAWRLYAPALSATAMPALSRGGRASVWTTTQ